MVTSTISHSTNIGNATVGGNYTAQVGASSVHANVSANKSGVSISAGAQTSFLSATTTASLKIGGITVEVGAKATIGYEASVSFSAGKNGFSIGGSFANLIGGGLILNVKW